MKENFLQHQIGFIQETVKTLSEFFEEPVTVEFLDYHLFAVAVFDCDSDQMISVVKKRLFNWQLENTPHWNEKLIRITDQEGKCLLDSTAQSQQIMILQF
jgi:hypothetical protein